MKSLSGGLYPNNAETKQKTTQQFQIKCKNQKHLIVQNVTTIQA